MRGRRVARSLLGSLGVSSPPLGRVRYRDPTVARPSRNLRQIATTEAYRVNCDRDGWGSCMADGDQAIRWGDQSSSARPRVGYGSCDK